MLNVLSGLPTIEVAVLSDVGIEESPNAFSLLGTQEPVGTQTVAITWAYVATGLESANAKAKAEDFMVTGKRPSGPMERGWDRTVPSSRPPLFAKGASAG